MKVTELLTFAQERHRIYLRRAEGAPKPWTSDEILQSYRFTNMYRQLDKVTIWINKNLRDPNYGSDKLPFLMGAARQINSIPCLQELVDRKALGPHRWDPEKARRVMNERAARGEQVYSGAYMLTGRGIRPEDPRDKPYYTCYRALTPLWVDAKYWAPQKGETLAGYHARLIQAEGFGGFLSAQVIADLKYIDPNLVAAPDWSTWACSGPGSRRGLARMINRPIKGEGGGKGDEGAKMWREEEWFEVFSELRQKVSEEIKKFPLLTMPHAQDLQGWLCEVDKYWRVQEGRGTPRSKYNGRGD